MYCPKCSQQQSSDEMRFCPRCGFALAGVAMLMDNDGVIPQPGRPSVQTLPSSRKKIMAESAIFTAIAWVVLIVATFWFDYGGAFESLAKIAAVLFFFLGLIGLLRFLYGFLFAKDVILQPALNAFPNLAPQGAMGEAPRRAALPVQRDLAATDYPRRGNTKEMMPQPSVTEHTTKLLEEPPIERSD
jgi:hypothetical protein